MVHPTGRLPVQPAKVETVYELMESPRDGIGFSLPIIGLEDDPAENVVAALLEYEGTVMTIGYKPDEGWVEIATTDTPPDQLIRYDSQCDLLANPTREMIKSTWGFDSIQGLDDPSVEKLAPPGTVFKMGFQHKPPRNAFSISLTSPLLGHIDGTREVARDEDGYIVAVVTQETKRIHPITLKDRFARFLPRPLWNLYCDIDNFFNEYIDRNIIFAWFDPDMETWRINKTVPVDALTLS